MDLLRLGDAGGYIVGWDMRPVEEFVQAYPEYGLGDAVGNG